MGSTLGPFGGLKAVFFDLDGTLVDSARDIHAALVAALLDLGLPTVSEQKRTRLGRSWCRALGGLRDQAAWLGRRSTRATAEPVYVALSVQRLCTQHGL